MKSNDPLETAYAVWRQQPRKDTLRQVLSAAGPVIDRAVQTHAGAYDSPLIRGRARVLAARAIRRYDPDRGASLPSYLHLQLQPLARYAQSSTAAVPVSEHKRRDLARLQRQEQDFIDQYGREPSDLELADRTQLSVKRITKLRAMASPVLGMETFPETASAAGPLSATLWDYVYHDADETDRRIMDYRRAGMSNTRIAQRLKLSPAAISQRTARLQKLLL